MRESKIVQNKRQQMVYSHCSIVSLNNVPQGAKPAIYIQTQTLFFSKIRMKRPVFP